jgi:hypothetical protein
LGCEGFSTCIGLLELLGLFFALRHWEGIEIIFGVEKDEIKFLAFSCGYRGL